ATTRMPSDIPPAIRSRCVEIFFRALTPEEIALIARNAADKVGFPLAEGALDVVTRYAMNGREAVNMIQIAAGVVQSEGRREIQKADVEWVVHSGQYTPRPDRKASGEPQVGCVYGLAVYGPNLGMLVEVEASAIPVGEGRGHIVVTGVMEEEEIGGAGHTMRRRSQARSSLDNVLTVLRKNFGLKPRSYDIHVNFPGGAPVDGPSAGVAMVTAIYSAITGQPVSGTVAMTGEVSIRGLVRP